MTAHVPCMPEPIRSVTHSAITTSLAALGAAVGKGDKSLVIVYNGLDVAAALSLGDANNDHFHIPAGASLTLSLGSEGKRVNTGDTLYIRALSSASSGTLYLSIV